MIVSKECLTRIVLASLNMLLSILTIAHRLMPSKQTQYIDKKFVIALSWTNITNKVKKISSRNSMRQAKEEKESEPVSKF